MKRKYLLLLTLLSLVVAALVWSFVPSGSDPQLQKVAELRDKLLGMDAATPPEARRRVLEEFRQELDKLTDDERDRFLREYPRPLVRDVAAFFELSQEEQQRELDKRIDAMESHKRDEPPQGEHIILHKLDPAKPNEMRTRMLDNTSPEQRAMLDEYFRRLDERRQQRGLPPMRGDDEEMGPPSAGNLDRLG